jgi:hypothetical protein
MDAALSPARAASRAEQLTRSTVAKIAAAGGFGTPNLLRRTTSQKVLTGDSALGKGVAATTSRKESKEADHEIQNIEVHFRDIICCTGNVGSAGGAGTARASAGTDVHGAVRVPNAFGRVRALREFP